MKMLSASIKSELAQLEDEIRATIITNEGILAQIDEMGASHQQSKNRLLNSGQK
jgi:hypothetical protein